MSTIPRNYLSRKGAQWRTVKVLDLAVMLYNVHAGARIEEVGFEDAQRTLADLTRSTNRTVNLDPGLIESCLWSCNLLDERGEFRDPTGRGFDQLVKDVLGADGFDRVYNLIKKKE